MNARLRLTALAAATALFGFCPVAAHAQEDVMRDAFGFFGSSLDVQVETEAPGRVRLIRGQRSRIEVAGRAPNGFASAALGGHGVRRLTLTALGSDRVDFVVVVPEDVRVRVSWPGASRSELFGTLSESAVYAWETPIDRPAFETVRPRSSSTAAPNEPRVLDVRGAHRLDRLTLRLGEETFHISGGRAERRGAGGTLHLDAIPRTDLGIDVPDDERFTLRLDGVDAVVIDGNDVLVLCESVLTQTLPDGRRWLTLSPVPRGGCSLLHDDQPAPRAAPERGLPATRRT